MSDSVAIQMQRILDEYDREVRDVADEVMNEVSKEAANKLKATSPKRPGHGEYARSWTVKVEHGAHGINTYTVHNKKHYRLTHLLEKGHVIRNGVGTYGRAPAHVHIKPVEEWANDEVVAEIERRL